MTDDEELRAFTRRLMSREDRTPMPRRPEPPAVRQGLHVPREGQTSDARDHTDDAARTFAADLFGVDLNARDLNTTPLS